MKPKLILFVLVVVVVAGLAGFWYGSYRTYVRTEKQHSWLNQWDFHEHAKTRAWLNLRLLTNLDAGRVSETRDMLETQLSEALSQHLCPWDAEPPYLSNSPDLMLIRDIRGYRSLHPWTNDPPERAERIQNAFNMVK
jgi:diadenosine tetraphosphatase ApaH/serine/threonine PP2A family protein phosphatase